MFTAAGIACAAEDLNAPLAGAKQQLQSLRKDETVQKAAVSDGIKLDLPALNTPDAGAALPPPKRDESAAKQKDNSQRDWLLEGFDRLERRKSARPRGATTGNKDDDGSDPEKPLDPSAPNYFLRHYEHQRAQSEAQHLTSVGAPDDRAANAGSLGGDPFAPFMKDWLANSPVRDALQNAVSPSATRAVAAIGNMPSAPRSIDGGQVGSVAELPDAKAAQRGARANPFVQALGLPSVDQPAMAESRSMRAETALTISTANSTPSTTVYDLPERAKPDVKRVLPPPPSEDKKYFPQLKKF